MKQTCPHITLELSDSHNFRYIDESAIAHVFLKRHSEKIIEISETFEAYLPKRRRQRSSYVSNANIRTEATRTRIASASRRGGRRLRVRRS